MSYPSSNAASHCLASMIGFGQEGDSKDAFFASSKLVNKGRRSQGM